MKLQILKRDALDELKENVDVNYQLYFRNFDNSWIIDRYEDNPFVTFKEIPDFKLAELTPGKKAGEIDLENCKIIYSNLKFLTESQASDERLWAGLAHGTFYDYMRRRWKYNSKRPYEKAIGEIKTRYFFKGSQRAGMFRHTLAKCWWIGRAFYDSNTTNHFEKLDALGANDFSTKISDIFFNNTFSSNSEILDGIALYFKYFNEKQIDLSQRYDSRPSLQLLNSIGGNTILDVLDKETIAEIMIKNTLAILNNNEKGIDFSNSDDIYEDEEIDEEQTETDTLPSENIDKNVSDNNESSNRVVIGNTVHLKNINNGNIKKYRINYINGVLPEVNANLLNKQIGEQIMINEEIYVIVRIES